VGALAVNPVRYVTLAYGDQPGVYRQSLMMLVSLVAFAPEPYELVVATDRPERYVWFGTRVEIDFLDPARLAKWRGPDPFSMRQKLACAIEASVPDRAATVLLDADVLAIKDLTPFVERLRRGELFMHRREYVLSKTRRSGHQKLWRTVREHGFTPDDGMWNSGVIAVSAADAPLLRQALEMYDQTGAAGLRHFVTEQLVEGAVFGRTGRLRAAEEWFVHYWGNRPGYDAEIARRLADDFIEGMSVKDAAAHYRENPISLPAEVRPSKLQKLNLWLQRIAGDKEARRKPAGKQEKRS
jgi:hypothetical protein